MSALVSAPSTAAPHFANPSSLYPFNKAVTPPSTERNGCKQMDDDDGGCGPLYSLWDMLQNDKPEAESTMWTTTSPASDDVLDLSFLLLSIGATTAAPVASNFCGNEDTTTTYNNPVSPKSSCWRPLVPGPSATATPTPWNGQEVGQRLAEVSTSRARDGGDQSPPLAVPRVEFMLNMDEINNGMQQKKNGGCGFGGDETLPTILAEDEEDWEANIAEVQAHARYLRRLGKLPRVVVVRANFGLLDSSASSGIDDDEVSALYDDPEVDDDNVLPTSTIDVLVDVLDKGENGEWDEDQSQFSEEDDDSTWFDGDKQLAAHTAAPSND